MIGKPLSELYNRIQYHFQDEALCQRALSHRSWGHANNERLEFLGDAVLALVTSEYLFQRFMHAKEGELSRLRALLVCGEHLAQSAVNLGLGDFLKLGPGEMRSGGYRRESILENALEALIGAIYLDGGLEAARAMIFYCFKDSLETLNRESISSDCKTRLQEHCQKWSYELPVYEVLSIQGAPHDQIFSVSCDVKALTLKGYGQSTNRKAAEQIAAMEVLKQLGLQND